MLEKFTTVMQTQTETFILPLSRREKEILNYIAMGLSSKEIGDKLYVTKNTIDTHRRNMIRKRKVKSTMELVYEMA